MAWNIEALTKPAYDLDRGEVGSLRWMATMRGKPQPQRYFMGQWTRQSPEPMREAAE